MTEAQYDPQKGARFIASGFRLVVLERNGDEVVCEYHDGGGVSDIPKTMSVERWSSLSQTHTDEWETAFYMPAQVQV